MNDATPILTRDRISAVAIAAGSVGMVALMALHPSVQSHGLRAVVREIAEGADASSAVHGALLVMAAVSAAGHAGLAARLRPGFLARTGLLAWLGGTIGMVAAGLINGFAVGALAKRFIDSPDLTGLAPVLAALWELNQAAAGAGVVLMSTAVLLWSGLLVQGPGAARVLGIAGCVAGLATIGALLGGALTLDVHGFGLFVLGQALWSLAAAILLWTRKP